MSDVQATVSPTGAAGALAPARLGGKEIAATKPRSPLSNVWRQFRRSKTSLAGVVLLALLVGGAVFAPVLAPYDFDEQTRDAREAPSREHIFGTDTFGRDVYSRVLYGGRLSLTVGVISVGIGLSLGTVFGFIGGYIGRWVDGLIGIFTDAMLAFPSILLAMAIIAILGRSLTNVMIAVGIASIPAYIRLVRSSVIAAKNLPYVEAAQVIGSGPSRVMLRHLLPNVIGPVTVLATLSIATAILTAAGLELSGPWCATAHPRVGRDGQRWPPVHAFLLVDRHDARHCDHAHRPGNQSHRRRPSGCHRPEVAAIERTSPPTPSPLRRRGASGRPVSALGTALATAPLPAARRTGEGVGGEGCNERTTRSMRSPVRALLVGVGTRGKHWARIMHDEPLCETVGYMDVDPAGLAAIQEQYPATATFTDLDEALAGVDADLVVLATPPMGHLEQAGKIYASGRHLLAEKPLTLDLAEAIEIVRLADASG